MGTNKIARILLVIFLGLAYFSVSAQSQSLEDLIKANRQLEKDIKTAVAATLRLSTEISSYKSEIQNIQNQIDAVKGQCEQIKAMTDKKLLDKTQKEVDDLATDVEDLLEQKTKLVSDLSQKEERAEELSHKIANMGVYSDLNDQRMLTDYIDLLAKPYSQMSLQDLSAIESRMGSLAKQQGYDELVIRLNAAKNNKRLYDIGVKLLESRYDSTMIVSTRDKLYSLLKINNDDLKRRIVKLSANQYSEIDSLDIKLSRYNKGIDVLQNIVKKVNNSGIRQQYQDDKHVCVEAMRAIVFSDAQEDVNARQRYFDTIQSLNELYQRYWRELSADPYTYPTRTEKKIMNLKD